MHQTSHKPVSVTSQCLAVVLTKETTSGTDWSSTKSGHRVFQSFMDENRESFWNPALVESVCSLDFVGFMKPGTLLVSGSEAHLECLRSAWARRVLKPPRGYQIKSLGDIGGIEMQEVPQTQFVPLPEVLCLVISQLNRVGHPATLDTVADEIAHEYPGMAVPGPEMLHAALTGLGSEGKVYCMGDHYFVSTPLMFQHYRQTAFGAAPPTAAFWGDSAPYHMGPGTGTVGPKHLQAIKQESCTRECQTGASIVNAPAFKVKTKKDQATLADVHECAAQNDENHRRSRKDDDGVERCRSLKDKDKKTGFFARLFRRSRSREKIKNKEETETPASSSKTQPTATQAATIAVVDQPTNSLGTFSAQFPPTEWLYDPRLHHQSTHGKSRKRDKVALKGVFDPPKIADKKASANRLSSQRFCTFPENLNEESVITPTAAIVQTRGNRKHHRSHFRQSKYLSSSSECLNYGPIDPPELLPNYAEAEAFDEARRRRRKHRRSERVERLLTSGRTDSTLRVLESVDSADDPTPRAHELGGWLQTEPSGGRTSTPVHGSSPALEPPLQDPPAPHGNGAQQLAVQPGGSDSAYSPSPVVTDMSNSSRDKFSSWSGSEAAKADPMDHTYINLDHRAQEIPSKERRAAHMMEMGGELDSSLESTRFENVTNMSVDSVARRLSDAHLQDAETVRPVKSVHISNV